MRHPGIIPVAALFSLFCLMIFVSPGRCVIEDEYIIKVGDALYISVWGHEDLEQRVSVRSDGTVRFPLVGEVDAAGYTITEFSDNLREELDRDYIIDPFVNVTVETPTFFVIGEVNSPGQYKIEGNIDVLKAISVAGGFTEFASHKVKIIRKDAFGQDTIMVNVDEIMKGRSAGEDAEIKPNDVIIVP
jgi:polysaccharide export outer membrane protein